MSFTAIRSAISSISKADITPSAKLVLIALANRHNQETGRCDPSVETIARDVGITVRSVRYALRDLEKSKLITTTFRRRSTGNGKRNLNNRYRIRGGAKFAGGVGQNLPPKQEPNASAYDDLVCVLESEENLASKFGIGDDA